jgi:NAD(P)H-dependent flavin oxidoreductase YrpB (nitropropane dioxygenase family)
VPDAVKQKYLATQVNGTLVTRSVDGYPQRVIKTDVIARLEASGPFTRFPRAAFNALCFLRLTGTSFADLLREGLAMKKNQALSYSQLAMAANAPMLTKAALVDGKLDAGILPTGQVVGLIEELPSVAELIQRIIREAEDSLARLSRETRSGARTGSLP